MAKKIDPEYDNRVGPERFESKAQKPKHVLLKLLALGGCSLIGLWGATQYLASTFQYQPVLGTHYNHIYAPWKMIEWEGYWHNQYPKIFEQAEYIVFGGVIAGFFLIIIGTLIAQSKLKGSKYLHGSARWSNEKDIIDAGLIRVEKKHGKTVYKTPGIHDPVVYVGAFRDQKNHFHYLTHSGPEHVLCFAPTRSGKGVGLVVPTMLSWGHSVVANDIKGELWALTAGYRQKELGGKCIRLEFAAKGSAHWNPLDEIRVGTEYEIGDVQNLAQMIVDPDGKGLDGPDGHWKKTAFALYTGLILFVIEKSKQVKAKPNPTDDEKKFLKANLQTIDYLLANSAQIKDLWAEMAQSPNETIKAAGKDMADRPDDEAGSVLSTVKSHLALYRDPIVAENVSDSDFSIRDLMNCKVPVSLYLISQPSDKGRIRPILRIFVCMCMRLLVNKMKFEKGQAVKIYQHRLLMMLDEFPALGKMEIVQESLAFVAGYGIKCYLITQDLGQLYSAYGKEESVTSNCHIQNCFPAIKDDTCDYISRMTGDTTVVREVKSRSGSGLNANYNYSVQETQRRLLTPGEVKSLPGAVKNAQGMIEKAGKMLIFSAGHPPIFGEQPLYFFDETFKQRSAIPEPQCSDKITDTDRVFRTEDGKPCSKAEYLNEIYKNSGGYKFEFEDSQKIEDMAKSKKDSDNAEKANEEVDSKTEPVITPIATDEKTINKLFE